jgi:hypothetical protein
MAKVFSWGKGKVCCDAVKPLMAMYYTIPKILDGRVASCYIYLIKPFRNERLFYV